MGITRGTDIIFYHDYDCNMYGCSGHKMRVDFSRTSDISTFYIDDEEFVAVSQTVWDAMKEAWKQCN